MLFLLASCARPVCQAAGYTRLEQLPPPKILAASDAYPGGQHEAYNLLDGNPASDYSSNGKGTNTFVEFDFGKPVQILGFRHVDRNDPATVARSELTFTDEAGKVLSTWPVHHVNRRAGVSFLSLPSPVTAHRARLQITELGAGLATVGGAKVAFYTAGQTDAVPSATTLETRALELLEQQDAKLVQWLSVTLN